MSSRNELENFVCEKCGWCCQLSGYVRVTEEEIDQIARHLGLAPEQLRDRYTQTMPWDKGTAVILVDHPGTTRCIFLDEDNRCRVHAVKPQQCRTFPADWKRAGCHLHCRGLQRLGKE